VSELADVGGAGISIGQLKDLLRAEPINGILWPNQPEPSKAHWTQPSGDPEVHILLEGS